jgi:hypothetical protein
VAQPTPSRHAAATMNCLRHFLLAASLGFAASAAEPAAPFPGKKSVWNGYDRHDFQVDGKNVLVVAPKQAAPGKPWVWHGEFFGHKPAPDVALLGRGFHVVYLSVPNLLGCPDAVAHWNKAYAELTGKFGFAKKAALVGLSRGGLYCYNWAIANPDKVACIYADAPVCDFKSWPGGKGKGRGSPNDWALTLKVHRFADEAAALAYTGNPVDNLAPLARAKVPLLHVFGDADDVVPWDENTGLVAERYKRVFRKPFYGGVDLPVKPWGFRAAHFSGGSSNSNCRGSKAASNALSAGVSSQTMVRSNTALSVHKPICHVSRRLLKNTCPKPSWFFSNDCAGSIHGRTWRNSRLATRLASGSRPSNVSCAPAA